MTVVVLVGRGRSSVCGSPCVTFCQDDCSCAGRERKVKCVCGSPCVTFCHDDCRCAGRERKVECVWLSLCDILSG